jgi:hypothetical protein
LAAKVIISAAEEIDIIFSTPNSFKRYERDGFIKLLAKKLDDGIKVRPKISSSPLEDLSKYIHSDKLKSKN